jgi:hypothetical protein
MLKEIMKIWKINHILLKDPSLMNMNGFIKSNLKGIILKIPHQWVLLLLEL